MARKDFDSPESIADAIPHNPVRRGYRCFAERCPMPGTITPSGASGASCSWHYGVLHSDIPKVTRALLDWQCVSYEVNEARRVLTGDLAADPKAIDEAFRNAWERLKPLVVGWETQLQPGNIRTSKGVERPFREGYADWAKRLEQFVGARVVEVLSIRQRQAA